MNQLKSLARDTWWLWLAVLVGTGLQIYYIGTFFFVNLPILAVVFIYFAFVRYDSNGNVRLE